MKTYRITKEWLKANYACYSGQEIFAKAFPRGLTLTDDQETNFERLRDAVQYYDDVLFATSEDRLVDHLEWLALEIFCKTSDDSTYDELPDVYGMAGTLAELVARARKR